LAFVDTILTARLGVAWSAGLRTGVLGLHHQRAGSETGAPNCMRCLRLLLPDSPLADATGNVR
jgi:hypothetical protein